MDQAAHGGYSPAQIDYAVRFGLALSPDDELIVVRCSAADDEGRSFVEDHRAFKPAVEGKRRGRDDGWVRDIANGVRSAVRDCPGGWVGPVTFLGVGGREADHAVGHTDDEPAAFRIERQVRGWTEGFNPVRASLVSAVGELIRADGDSPVDGPPGGLVELVAAWVMGPNQNASSVSQQAAVAALSSGGDPDRLWSRKVARQASFQVRIACQNGAESPVAVDGATSANEVRRGLRLRALMLVSAVLVLGGGAVAVAMLTPPSSPVARVLSGGVEVDLVNERGAAVGWDAAGVWPAPDPRTNDCERQQDGTSRGCSLLEPHSTRTSIQLLGAVYDPARPGVADAPHEGLVRVVPGQRLKLQGTYTGHGPAFPTRRRAALVLPDYAAKKLPVYFVAAAGNASKSPSVARMIVDSDVPVRLVAAEQHGFGRGPDVASAGAVLDLKRVRLKAPTTNALVRYSVGPQELRVDTDLVYVLPVADGRAAPVPSLPSQDAEVDCRTSKAPMSAGDAGQLVKAGTVCVKVSADGEEPSSSVLNNADRPRWGNTAHLVGFSPQLARESALDRQPSPGDPPEITHARSTRPGDRIDLYVVIDCEGEPAASRIAEPVRLLLAHTGGRGAPRPWVTVRAGLSVPGCGSGVRVWDAHLYASKPIRIRIDRERAQILRAPEAGGVPLPVNVQLDPGNVIATDDEGLARIGPARLIDLGGQRGGTIPPVPMPRRGPGSEPTVLRVPIEVCAASSVGAARCSAGSGPSANAVP